MFYPCQASSRNNRKNQFDSKQDVLLENSMAIALGSKGVQINPNQEKAL